MGRVGYLSKKKIFSLREGESLSTQKVYHTVEDSHILFPFSDSYTRERVRGEDGDEDSSLPVLDCSVSEGGQRGKELDLSAREKQCSCYPDHTVLPLSRGFRIIEWH